MRKTTVNSTYEKLAVNWLNEALCSDSYRDFVAVNSLMRRQFKK